MSASRLKPDTYLELMPKAVMKASFIWYIKVKGLLLRTTRKISGRMMNAWIIKPTITVTMNNASLLSSSPMSTMLATRCAIRLQIPTGAYLQTTTEKKTLTHITQDHINKTYIKVHLSIQSPLQGVSVVVYCTLRNSAHPTNTKLTCLVWISRV